MGCWHTLACFFWRCQHPWGAAVPGAAPSTQRTGPGVSRGTAGANQVRLKNNRPPAWPAVPKGPMDRQSPSSLPSRPQGEPADEAGTYLPAAPGRTRRAAWLRASRRGGVARLGPAKAARESGAHTRSPRGCGAGSGAALTGRAPEEVETPGQSAQRGAARRAPPAAQTPADAPLSLGPVSPKVFSVGRKVSPDSGLC